MILNKNKIKMSNISNEKKQLIELENKMFLNRLNDIEKRGGNCLVYDYFGRLIPLSQSHIWYNSKLEYIPPKQFIIIEKKKDKSCIVM